MYTSNAIPFTSRVRPNPNTAKPVKVALFGASIMYNSYERTKEQVESDGKIELRNYSVCGQTSDEALARIDEIAQSDADVVVLCHGGNDVIKKLFKGFINNLSNAWNSISGGEQTPYDGLQQEIKSNISTMIETLQDAGKEVVLIGVDPTQTLRLMFNIAPPREDAGFAKTMQEKVFSFLNNINSIFPALKEEHGILFYKHSLYEELAQEDIPERTDVHPTQEGYNKIADGLAPIIREAAIHVRANRMAARSADMGISAA